MVDLNAHNTIPKSTAHTYRSRLTAAVSMTIAALALAGCASTSPQTPRTATTVPLTEAMIFPPPGGPALLSVVEIDYANATRQNIALATNSRTPGENMISITRFLGRGGDGNDGELPDSDAVDLYAEASEAWPEVSMMVSPFFVQNFYGPFGYAVGGAPTGDKCVYAWQRIAPSERSSGTVGRGSVIVRLQLCDQTSSEQTLLRMMYQMRLRDPVFQPWRASPAIGQPGVAIMPQSVGGFQNVLDLPEAQPPRRTTQAAPVQQVSAPTQPAPTQAPAPAPRPAPQPTGPIVPLPGGGTGGGAGAGPSSGTTGGVFVPPPPRGE